MQGKKFVFAGNRFFVLEEMLKRHLDVIKILAVKDSYLERILRDRGLEYSIMESKAALVSVLESTDFDYFVANGCPFILPISQLADGRKAFLNVHPSALPDLRGADPVPGALLFHRDSGATCHLMDDGIDTGMIISRIRIPNTDDLDAGLLYQLSFMAEREVFALALDREFKSDIENVASGDLIYYTLRAEDRIVDFSEPTEKIVCRIRAFSNRAQGARFEFREHLFKVFDAEMVRNPYLLAKITEYQENEVIFNYESSLLIRHGDAFLKLKSIDGNLSQIRAGDRLT